MKILITGGNGFIAKSLSEAFQDKYEVVSCNRQQLDLLDSDAVSEHIKKGKYDAVIHSATYDAAPFYSTKDPAKVLENNLKMFFHIARCSDQFGKMIYFGSGAEFSRRHWKPKMTEDYFDQHVPQDQYGLSKYIMTKYAQVSNNIYNLRLFGLFGKYDDWRYRFLPNICARAALKQSIVVKSNRIFDFMSIQDLVKIVAWFLENKPKHRVYNVCSGRVYRFYELAQILQQVVRKDLDVVLKNDSQGDEYSGDPARLLTEMKDFKFIPIEEAIKSLYEWYSTNKELINITNME